MQRMMNIPELHIPEENVAIWEHGFSAEDIDEIISLGELMEFSKGKIGGGNIENSEDNGIIDDEIRNTDIIFIEPSDQSHWLYRRMTELCAKINLDKFKFELNNFQPLQYAKYKVDGHYDWHTDSGPSLPEHRKLSFVLGLTDPDEYEGGILELNVTGNSKHCLEMKIKKGHLVVFPSYIPHRVTKVTEGERLTLVGWAVGPKFK